MFIVVLDLSVLRFTIPIKVNHIGEFCLLINIFTSYASTSVPLKVNSCLRITFQVIIYRNSPTWIWMNLRQDNGCLAIWPRTNNPIEKVRGHVLYRVGLTCSLTVLKMVQCQRDLKNFFLAMVQMLDGTICICTCTGRFLLQYYTYISKGMCPGRYMYAWVSPTVMLTKQKKKS